jgi:hypothetical protein
LRELWCHGEADSIDCLLVHSTVVAATRSSGWLDLYSLQSGALLQRIRLRKPVQAAALLDNLWVGLAQDQVEVVHLTPLLCQDACRYDRNSNFSSGGELASPLAQDSQRLFWVARQQLVCYQARPQGLQKQWQALLPGPSPGLALWGEWVFALVERSLFQFDARSGEQLNRTELPFQPQALKQAGDALWISGREGDLWKWKGGELTRGWAGPSRRSYQFGANPSHVVLCAGRTVLNLNLNSGRQCSLELPQPCVLAPLLGENWALLSSYEGMLYQLALDQESPRVVQARRPFTSFEPTTVQPLIAGDRVVLAGPEGQLAVWSL